MEGNCGVIYFKRQGTSGDQLIGMWHVMSGDEVGTTVTLATAWCIDLGHVGSGIGAR